MGTSARGSVAGSEVAEYAVAALTGYFLFTTHGRQVSCNQGLVQSRRLGNILSREPIANGGSSISMDCLRFSRKASSIRRLTGPPHFSMPLVFLVAFIIPKIRFVELCSLGGIVSP